MLMESNHGYTPRPPGPPGPPGRAMPPDPSRAADVLDTFTVMVHEMSNLLDGSLRWLGLAHRTIDQARNPAPGNDLPAEDALDQASWQIETARGALERMADLVHAAMRSAGVPIGSRLLAGAEPVGLLDTISHAVRVVGPEAVDRGIALFVDIAPPLRSLPSGAMYAVVLNALRNAIESIAQAQRFSPGGRIEVVAVPGPLPGSYCVEVRDDGVGPPVIERPDRVFEHGYSTKQSGSGIGLSLAGSIVQDAGGTIRLMRGADLAPIAFPDPRRPGAVLRIVMPDQSRDLDAVVGRDASADGRDPGGES